MNMINTRRVISACLLIGLCNAGVFALTSGPVQPEFTSFEAVDASDLVNLPTGDFTYVLPLGDVRGPAGVGYPIVLSYHAGIMNDQEATWVGLGWSLNAGAINRAVRGFPDDCFQTTAVQYAANKGDHGWSASVGVGWGPVSANVQFSYKASGGHSFDGVGVGFGAKEGNIGVGMNMNFGREGVSVGLSLGLDVGNNMQIGLSMSAGSNGPPVFGASVGYDAEQKPHLFESSFNQVASFSINSTGNVGMSMAGSSAQSSSMSLSDKGLYETSTGCGLTIPLPFGFTISFGYNEWSWYYAQMGIGSTYGYLYQNLEKTLIDVDYADNLARNTIPPCLDLPATKFEHVPNGSGGYTIGNRTASLAITSPISNGMGDRVASINHQAMKFEQIATDSFCLSAQDNYSISGQGVGGVFQPFSRWSTKHCYVGGGKDDSKFNGNIAKIVSGNGVTQDYKLERIPYNDNLFTTNPPVGSHIDNAGFSTSFSNGFAFKLLGEQALNLIDGCDPALYTASNGNPNYENIDLISANNPGNTYGTRIEPIFSTEFSGKLAGFIVTDQQGKSYYYTKPLYQLHKLTYSNEIADEPKDNGNVFVFDQTHSFSLENEPYALTWLLTAITGPDYIKMISQNWIDGERSVLPQDGDAGYWVKFSYSYGKNSDAEDRNDEVVTYRWRTPYWDDKTLVNKPFLHEPCPNEQYYSSVGMREMTYLKSIETPTEVAFFRTSDRLDGMGIRNYPTFAPTPLPSSWITANNKPVNVVIPITNYNADQYGVIPDYASTTATQSDLNHCMVIALDKNAYSGLADYFNNLPDGSKILSINYNSDEHYYQSHVFTTLYRNPVVAGSITILKDSSDCSVNGKIVKISQKLGVNVWWSMGGIAYAKCFKVEETATQIKLYITKYHDGNVVVSRVNWQHAKYYYTWAWGFNGEQNTQQRLTAAVLDGGFIPYSKRNDTTIHQKKLYCIAWYSKAQYPFISGISDPEVETDDYIDPVTNVKKTSASNRRVKFHYSYDCAPNTPNSEAINQGRLTLKAVWTEAGPDDDAHKIILPPYVFNYQNANISYGSFDGYQKVDPWGFRKAVPSAQQNNPQMGVNWNLSLITVPSGGTIAVDYERDNAYSSLANVLDLKNNFPCEDNRGVVNGLEGTDRSIILHNTQGYSKSGKKTTFSITDPVATMQNLSTGMLFLVRSHSKCFNCTWTTDENQNITWSDKDWWCTNYTFRLDEIDITHKTISTYTPFMGDISKKTGTYTGNDPYGNSNGDNTSTWNIQFQGMDLMFIKQSNIYCEGLKVKSITSSSNSQTYITKYNYPSTGGCLQLLPAAAIPGDFLQDTNDGNANQRYIKSIQFSDDLRYNYSNGNTGIIYPWIEVCQVKPDGTTKVNGSKKTWFWTADDMLSINGQTVPLVNIIDSRNAAGVNIRQIWDRQGLIGMTKNVQFLDNNNNIVYEKQNEYKFGDQLIASNGVVYSSMNSLVSTSKAAPGVINTRSIMVNKDGVTKSLVDLIMETPYLVSVTEIKDKVTTRTDYGLIDARTGSPLLTVTTNSDNQKKADVKLPYRFAETNGGAANQAMAEKNIYSLQAGGFIENISHLNYTPLADIKYSTVSNTGLWWRTDSIKAATAQTYYYESFTGSSVPFEQSRFWLHKTYSLKDNTTAFTWPTDASASSSWLKKSEIIKVDKYTRPQCEMDVKGIKTTAIYHPRMNAVTGVVANADFSECAVFTGDYDEQDAAHAGYFDYQNGWEKGGGASIQSSPLSGFSPKAIYIDLPNDNSANAKWGPGRNFKILPQKDYIMTARVYVVDGTLIMSGDYRYITGSSVPYGCSNQARQFGGTSSLASESTKNEWRLMKIKIPASSDITTTDWSTRQDWGVRVFVGSPNGVKAYITDIRFYPSKALVSTFYYDQNLGVPIAFVDANNKCKRYEYDAYGRLTKVKNNAGDIVKTASYTMGQPHTMFFINAPSSYYPFWIDGTKTWTIKWATVGLQVANVKIEYSLDGGVTWATITTSPAPNNGNYAWSFPSVLTPKDNCRLRISDAANSNTFSLSEPFSIYKSYRVISAAVIGDQQHYAYRDGAGNIWDSWYDDGDHSYNHQLINLGGKTTGPATAGGPCLTIIGQQEHFVYRDGSGKIWDSWYNGSDGSWNLQQINLKDNDHPEAKTDAPAAAGDPRLVLVGEQQHFVYRDGPGTIWDAFYYKNINNVWTWTKQQMNLKTTTNNGLTDAPAAAGDPSLVLVGEQQHFVYRDGFGKIWDAFYYKNPNNNNAWTWTKQQMNLKTTTNNGLTDAPAAAGDPCFTVIDNQQHVTYRDVSGTIWDAYYPDVNGGWTKQQINLGGPTGQTDGPKAAGDPFVSVFVDQQHYVYRGDDGKIWDAFYYKKNNVWTWDAQQINRKDQGGLTDVGAATSDPFVIVINNNQQHFVYRVGTDEIWDSWYDGIWKLQQISRW
jgi:YD repeat-containing protein